MKKETKTFLLMIIACIIFGSLIAFALSDLIPKEDPKTSTSEFYEEWCHKLNAGSLDVKVGYKGKCFREENNVIKFFDIMIMNGEYKLRELK